MIDDTIKKILSQEYLDEYLDLFDKNKVRLTTFLKLSDEELNRLGISNYFHRKAILSSIETYRKRQEFIAKQESEKQISSILQTISLFAILLITYLLLSYIPFYKIETKNEIVSIRGYDSILNFKELWQKTNGIQSFFLLIPIFCGACSFLGLTYIILLLLTVAFADNKSKWNIKFNVHIFDVDYSTEGINNDGKDGKVEKYENLINAFHLATTPIGYLCLLLWFLTIIGVIVYVFWVYFASTQQQINKLPELINFMHSYSELGIYGFIASTILFMYIIFKTID